MLFVTIDYVSLQHMKKIDEISTQFSFQFTRSMKYADLLLP